MNLTLVEHSLTLLRKHAIKRFKSSVFGKLCPENLLCKKAETINLVKPCFSVNSNETLNPKFVKHSHLARYLSKIQIVEAGADTGGVL